MAERRPAIGFWINLSDPGLAELAAVAGYDWVMVDMEHNPFSEGQVQNTIYAASSCDISCVVRVRSNSEDHVKWVLDCGAAGVIIPGIRDVADAERAVQISKYHPVGMRGYGPNRVSGFSSRTSEYTATANDDIALICQIELASAVQDIERICQVRGIDGFWIGPTDLAQSLGHLGAPQHAAVVRAIDSVIEAASRHERTWGIPTGNVDDCRRYIARGGQLMILGSDTGLLRAVATERVNSLRAAMESPKA